MSSMLPIFRASDYFCASSGLSLSSEVYVFSSQAEGGGVPAFARRATEGKPLACPP